MIYRSRFFMLRSENLTKKNFGLSSVVLAANGSWFVLFPQNLLKVLVKTLLGKENLIDR
jgi:hypothetical protein